MASYSPLWGTVVPLPRPSAQQSKGIAQDFDRGIMRRDRELIRTLLGAAAGATATKTRKRVAHSTTELGGKRTIETETRINRATTAADVTDLKARLFAFASQPATYPRDKMRNY